NGDCWINSTCTMAGQYNFTNLVVNNSAIVFVVAYDNTGYSLATRTATEANGWNGTGMLVLNVTGYAGIAAGASINANGVGYAGNGTPGNGTGGGNSTSNNCGGGGGHGGLGGNSSAGCGAVASGGVSYDLPFTPSDLGSGGGGATPGSGGGAVVITANQFQLNGSINANGSNPTGGTTGGGGSGGTVKIETNSTSGYGWINAAGGLGAGSHGGGGGGGRIAILFNTTHGFYANNTNVTGGSGINYGQTGTVIVVNRSASDAWVVNNFTLRGNEGVNYDLTPRYDGIYLLGNFNVTNGATTQFANNHSGDNAQGITLNLTGNFTLETNAILNGTGQGFPGSTSSSTRGQGPSAGSATAGVGSGGGNGGEGGNASNSGIALGGNYTGNPFHPTTPGSGGGGEIGGSGGAAIKIIAQTTTLNGNITANGQNGVSTYGGGGAGGSILITTENITGTGYIFATGGNGALTGSLSGGGGGGRIAIHYNNTNTYFNNRTNVTGGVGGYQNGRTGTAITINNPNRDAWAYTNFTLRSTEGANNDLTPRYDGKYFLNNFNITNGATVLFVNNHSGDNAQGITLNLTGNFTLETNAILTGTALGFPGSGGTRGQGPSAGTYITNTGSGGGNGGEGGNASNSGIALGGNYTGNPFHPTTPGSGG
ncbi:MAG: hypothetical protein AABW54_04990, partial [Candidatus Micrarchaeota archaeon]